MLIKKALSKANIVPAAGSQKRYKIRDMRYAIQAPRYTDEIQAQVEQPRRDKTRRGEARRGE